MIEISSVWLTCTCCGSGIRDTPDENVSHNEQPNPHDVGYGLCVPCGGDKKSRGLSERATRKRIGWAGEVFFDARIKLLLEKLNEKNAEEFRRRSYASKVAMVTQLIEKGVLT